VAKQKRTDAERRARQCERIGRVLRVLQFVLSRGEPWDAEGIAKELEVSERTVYRDIQTLQLAGVPVYHDEQAGGYRVRPGFRLTCLDDHGDRPHARGREDAAATPEQLADASLNAAQRLLSDTQELVDLLTRLRDTLGSQTGPSTGHRPHRRRSSS
jgi:biotin operon repressor